MINLDIRYKYVGDGHWMTGIPKRDLTARDLILFDLDEKVLQSCGLYEKVQPKKEEKPSKKAGE